MRRGPFEPIDFTTIDGIACTTVARTLCDLGSVDPYARVKVAFESAWRNGLDLPTLRATAERLSSHHRPGPATILGLIDEAEHHGRPTESALEVNVEAVICSIPGVVRQHRALRDDGSFVARVDFAVPELKIAIEAHSRKHHFGPHAESADARREAELQAEGWIVRYITDDQRHRPEALRTSLHRLIAARQRTTGGMPAASWRPDAPDRWQSGACLRGAGGVWR